MTRLLIQIALRTAACALLAWLAWRVAGPTIALLTVPLLGVVLARPLLDLAGELRHQARALVWRPLEGRHFTFHGVPIQVLEDADHRRWIRAADVRAVVGFTAGDGALALTYPNGWSLLGTPPQPHFSDDALVEHLAKESSPRALKFRHWAEREIVFSARRERERLGIRLAAPTQVPRD
jgi:hypothetical protein